MPGAVRGWIKNKTNLFSACIENERMLETGVTTLDCSEWKSCKETAAQNMSLWMSMYSVIDKNSELEKQIRGTRRERAKATHRPKRLAANIRLFFEKKTKKYFAAHNKKNGFEK